jgi:hypothetical protein
MIAAKLSGSQLIAESISGISSNTASKIGRTCLLLVWFNN